MLRILLLLCAAAILAGCSDADERRVIGTLERERIELTAPAAESVVALPVSEGERVAAGVLLVRFDSERVEAQLAQAEAERARAAAQLAELRRGPRRERIAEANARMAGAEGVARVRERELQRLRSLAEQGLASPEDVDRAEALLASARADERAARARLDELQAGATAEELEQAQQALSAAQARSRELMQRLAELTLEAPVAGLVDSLPFEVGERPAAGQVVVVLLSGETYARIYVPETIRVQISPGTLASVEVDGLAEPLNGRVRFIAEDPAFTPYYALTEYDRSRLSYRAEVALQTQGQRLPPGVPVEVRFPEPGP